VDFIDKQHRLGHLLKLGDDLFQTLLEIAAIARAGQQRAHVERIDHGILQHLGNIAFHDLAGEPFCNRGFADPGIPDIERVVLAAAAQDLDRAVDLRSAPDQRIDLAGLGLDVEIDSELVKRGFLLVSAFLSRFAAFGLRFIAARRGLRFELPPALADTVTDIAHRIEPAHILLLQEVDRIGIAFGKQRHQNIGARNGVLARRLDVQDRTLDHPLEPRSRLRVGTVLGLK